MANDLPLLQLTNYGIEYADTQEIYADVKEAFSTAFPNLNVDSVDTPQGQIIAYITERIKEQSNAIIEFTNCLFNGGFDSYEDINADLFFGIQRKGAGKSVVTATITGKPNTTIKKDFKASSGDLTYINSSGETKIKDDGSVEIQMTCEKEGEYQILANTLTTILTPAFGIETITNKDNSTKGTLAETDLWSRALKSQYNRAYALFESYVSNINNVKGVTDCVGFDNFTNVEVTYKGQVFKPHTFGIVVEGGDSYDIAKAMYKVRAPGPAMLGEVQQIVYGEYDNQEYVMRFSRPVYVDLRAKIVVKLGLQANENYKEVLQQQLIDIITKNQINRAIYSDNKATQLIMPNETYLVVLKLERITKDNASEEIQGQDIIELGFKEKARIVKANIVVEKLESESIKGKEV